MSAPILNLRDCPKHVETVAERIWSAWWRDEGHALEDITALVLEALGSDPIPTTLVAQQGGAFQGTVSVIENDHDARPKLTPWLAALWVDADQRCKGLGASLIRAALDHARSLGAPVLYLCATPDKASYYEGLGWTIIERDVDGLHIFSHPV